MASAGQGYLSKKDRRGLHPDRRERVAQTGGEEIDRERKKNENELVQLVDDKEETVAAGNDKMAKEAAA
jgi:hypothetical protein